MTEAVSALAAYAMIRQQERMKETAERAANASTPGYKQRFSLAIHDANNSQSAGGVHYPSANNQKIDLSQGNLQVTNNPLNAAIVGSGFFQVQDPATGRVLLTRRGLFHINGDGELVTSEGYQVLGQGGVISMPDDSTNITIGQDGTISSTSEGTIDQLQIVDVQNQDDLKYETNTFFSVKEEPIPAVNFKVQQGAFEQSNVQSIQETATLAELMQESGAIGLLLKQSYERRKNDIGNLSKIG